MSSKKTTASEIEARWMELFAPRKSERGNMVIDCYSHVDDLVLNLGVSYDMAMKGKFDLPSLVMIAAEKSGYHAVDLTEDDYELYKDKVTGNACCNVLICQAEAVEIPIPYDYLMSQPQKLNQFFGDMYDTKSKSNTPLIDMGADEINYFDN